MITRDRLALVMSGAALLTSIFGGTLPALHEVAASPDSPTLKRACNLAGLEGAALCAAVAAVDAPAGIILGVYAAWTFGVFTVARGW